MWDNEAIPFSTTEECIFTLSNKPCKQQKELQGGEITFVTAWDCAPELETGPARSVLQLQRFVFKLLLVDQELFQEQNSQGKPEAPGHFVAPHKQWALKWQLSTGSFPEQTNQLKDTVRWETVLWSPPNPAWAAVWNLSMLVQPVRLSRRVWRAGQDRSCLDAVGVMAGTLWLCLELPFAEDYQQGVGSQGLRINSFPDSAIWQV